MKKITFIIVYSLCVSYLAAQTNTPVDTTFHYNNRSVVVNEKNDEINVSVYRQNEQGDTLKSEKIYEGIFVDGKSVERQYDNRFEISIPGVFKPREKRFSQRSHYSGVGIGFSNLPKGFNFEGELSSILNQSRSLQYHWNFGEAFWRFGKSNFKGMVGLGIQFNSMHFQTNKYIEVEDYKSIISTTEPGKELKKSRLHFTYLTIPFLVETSYPLTKRTDFFINAGIVAKIKTASSSRIWFDENGKNQKMKMPGELNIRPLSFDLLVQAGIDQYGIFASYSPMSLFLDGKGPKGNQATVGLQIYF